MLYIQNIQLGAGRCQIIVKMFRNRAALSGTIYIRIHAIRKHKCKEGKNVRKCQFSFRIRFKLGNKFSKRPPLLEATYK
jgi:hypothetical protein